MSLSLIQRMDTLKVPKKFFELDYLAANFPSFCSFVDKNKRRQYRKKTIAMAKNIALRHRSLKNITGDINFQPIFMPNFKMKKGERADERSTVKIPERSARRWQRLFPLVDQLRTADAPSKVSINQCLSMNKVR